MDLIYAFSGQCKSTMTISVLVEILYVVNKS